MGETPQAGATKASKAKTAKKKVTKKTTKKVAKKVAKKTTKKVAKKVTKAVAKKTTTAAKRSQPKKVTKAVAKKATKKVAKKVTKAVAKKASKKVAKKTTKAVAKKATTASKRPQPKTESGAAPKKAAAAGASPAKKAGKNTTTAAKRPQPKEESPAPARNGTEGAGSEAPRERKSSRRRRGSRRRSGASGGGERGGEHRGGRRGEGRGENRGEQSESSPRNGVAKAGAEGEEQPRKRKRRRRRRRRGSESLKITQDLAGCRIVARKRFGIDRLHPEQEVGMVSVLEGRDTVVVLPTGFGKSLIYQVPAMMVDGPTIVISPLIALMSDQESALKRRGIPVVRLDSTLRVAERREALDRIAQGGRLVILTTPETLESVAARPYFAQAKPALLCIDEAHCISEWGHDFRPAYLRLGTERRFLGTPTVLALTATATPKVRDDISRQLRLSDPMTVTAPPHRPNLRLGVEIVPGNMKPEAAGRLLKRLQRPGIVYCSTTVEVDNIWVALNRARIPAARYHGKMSTVDRNAAQRRYMKPSKRLVMIATSAFGMGIDKPNIRYIVHYQAPGSLEQYVQEFGRAGRDGHPSNCTFLFDEADLRTQDHLMRQGRANVRQLMRVAKALKAWADEGKRVNAADLALSAEVPASTCRSLCTQLEEVGLVELDEERNYFPLCDPSELINGAKDLAGRFETMLTEDTKRLAAVKDYALTEECRSVFIRRYFGEDDPPKCGKCDRCKADRRHDQSMQRFTRTVEGIERGEEPGATPTGNSRRRRRRRKRRRPGDGRENREAGPNGSNGSTASTGSGGGGGGGREQRQRNGRSRRPPREQQPRQDEGPGIDIDMNGPAVPAHDPKPQDEVAARITPMVRKRKDRSPSAPSLASGTPSAARVAKTPSAPRPLVARRVVEFKKDEGPKAYVAGRSGAAKGAVTPSTVAAKPAKKTAKKVAKKATSKKATKKVAKKASGRKTAGAKKATSKKTTKKVAKKATTAAKRSQPKKKASKKSSSAE